nr:MAG TPA: hypothetical protein [Caudoviricetes sp.]
MLNHILGILIGYVLIGVVVLYIDGWIMGKRLRKELERERAALTDPKESARRFAELLEEVSPSGDEVVWFIFMNLVYLVIWPLKVKKTHDEMKIFAGYLLYDPNHD